MLNVYYSSTFAKHFKKLPKKIKLKSIQQEKKFRKNIQDPSLAVHKLRGELKDCYAFSINYEYRIMFALEDENSVTFIDVGTHSIYQ